MTEACFTVEQREEALATLSNSSEALFAALDRDGFRIAMPSSLKLPPAQVIPLPTDRATMIDLLLPGEAMKVVVAWEQAQQSSLVFSDVHARHEPERLLTLSFIDMRHAHGVFLAVLNPAGGGSSGSSATNHDLAGALATSVRPRMATMVKSGHALIVAIDDRAQRMLGWSEAQMAGKRSLEFIHPDDHERAVAAFLDMLAKEDASRIRLRHRCADGGWLWLEIEHTYQAATEPDGEPTVVAELTDISDEMSAHEELRRRERLFRRLAESLPVGVLQIDAHREPLYVNDRLASIIGASAPPTLEQLLTTIVAESRSAFDEALVDALDRGRDRELEIHVRSGSAEERTVAVNVISLGLDEGVPGALCCFADVTEEARLREELRAQATYDVLTGCLNRASVMSALGEALTTDGLVAAIFVDLDNFKPVNDEFGHEAGDELLVQSAGRLMAATPGGTVIGRLGGDEFLVVAAGLSCEGEACALAEEITAALGAPASLSRGTVDPSASVGVACSVADDTAMSLVKRADQAMYVAKAANKRCRTGLRRGSMPQPRTAITDPVSHLEAGTQ